MISSSLSEAYNYNMNDSELVRKTENTSSRKCLFTRYM